MTKSVFILLLISIFGVGIRLINIDKFGIGGDEKYSLTVMNGMSYEGATQKEEIYKPVFNQKKLWEAITLKDYDEAIIRTDNGNSASYYLVLNIWQRFFGNSEFSLRFLNLIFDWGSIILIYFLALLIFQKSEIGLLASVFVAIEPFMIGYSHQIRNYPMGIFLVLCSVYFLFSILKSNQNNKSLKLYLGYFLTVIFGIFSHYYVALFIFCQFLVLTIFYLRNWALVVRFGVVYSAIAVVLIVWFTVGSGRETISTLKYKDEVYKAMTLSPTKPDAFKAWLTVPTAANLKAKMAPILSDSFIITNQLFDHLEGNKNGFISIFLGLILGLALIQLKHNLLPFKELLVLLMIFLVLLIGIFIYNKNFIGFSYFSILIALFIFGAYQLYCGHWKIDFKFLTYFGLSIFIPFIISILGAIKAGHTANLYQKYFSFILPIYALFCAWFCYSLFHEKHWLQQFFLGLIGVYIIFNLVQILPKTLNDNFPKYTTFGGNRSFNPYVQLAQKIIKNYQKGDIVYFPNYNTTAFESVDSTAAVKYSVVDAQLTSLYLPHHADIDMAVDVKELNQCYLKKNAGNKVVLFNFQGSKYRY